MTITLTTDEVKQYEDNVHIYIANVLRRGAEEARNSTDVDGSFNVRAYAERMKRVRDEFVMPRLVKL